MSLIPGITELIADKGYDADAFRGFLKERGIKTVIPSKSNRKKRIRHDSQAHEGRNVVERSFCRLKDWRRIAKRLGRRLRQNVLLASKCLDCDELRDLHIAKCRFVRSLSY